METLGKKTGSSLEETKVRGRGSVSNRTTTPSVCQSYTGVVYKTMNLNVLEWPSQCSERESVARLRQGPHPILQKIAGLLCKADRHIPEDL